MNEEPNVFENNISQSSNYEPIPAAEEVANPHGEDLDEEEGSGTGTFAVPQTNNEVLEQVLLGGTFNAGKQEVVFDEIDEDEEEEREMARIERVLKD